jgi:hypothetical protein
MYVSITKPYSQQTLRKDFSCDVGFRDVILIVDRSVIWKQEYARYDVEKDTVADEERCGPILVRDLESMFGGLFHTSNRVLLWFNSSLEDELYQLNWKDGEWHLIHRGCGFC